ncbi:MAG: hypothetical protein BWX79_02697 [Alphaproteobacteria bacterium ADurb.Bin100]|nr:MAG: hypothetical protein BWX79_02697 [Alphaproteobacteria bacterium ADurb.Bin100]
MWPKSGSSTYWPNAMTRPEIANIEKAMALAQWAERSNGVKRSSLRPVGAPLSLMVPARQ